MNKQIKADNIVEEDEENFDFTNFNPDEMLTNKNVNMSINKYNYSIPPDEDTLTNNTLWPETNKLYGHGHEIISIASSHDGNIIASGGKAQSEKHSKLFLWNTEKNNLIAKLDGHNLTIIQIEFSYDDNLILTVSRDRCFCLYQKQSELNYKLIQKGVEVHARIIWGCSFSFDSNLFVTGSRDKTIKIWKRSDNEVKYVEALSYEFDNPVTTVNILGELINDCYIIFIGYENGDIRIYSYKKILKEVFKFPKYLCHGLTVKRIKSRRVKENNSNNSNLIRISSCSEDYSVRIYELNKQFILNKI
jgi:elongator complex protein 2